MKTIGTYAEIRAYLQDTIYEAMLWNNGRGCKYRLGYDFHAETFQVLSCNERYINDQDGIVLGEIDTFCWKACFTDEDLLPENIDETVDAYIDGCSDFIDHMIEQLSWYGLIDE